VEEKAPVSIALARLCLIAWCLAAVGTHVVGMWVGIGSVAAVLGALVVVQRRGVLASWLRPTPRNLALGVAAAIPMVAGTYILYGLLGGWLPVLREHTLTLYTVFNSSPSTLTLALLPIIILGEELVWRGAMQEALEARLGLVWGTALTGLIYALAHAPVGSPLLVALALGCGLYWGALRAVSGSLVAPLVAHLAWDAAVMVLWPLR
jgi:membrane protease YdiL (CAAX protease family)